MYSLSLSLISLLRFDFQVLITEKKPTPWFQVGAKTFFQNGEDEKDDCEDIVKYLGVWEKISVKYYYLSSRSEILFQWYLFFI